METFTDRVKSGFLLARTIEKMVLKHKVLWLFCIAISVVDILLNVLLYHFYRHSSCVICLVANWLFFCSLYYIISLLLFFYAYGLWTDEPVSFRLVCKKGFSKMKTIAFWFFVFLPLPRFLKMLFIPFIIPAIASSDNFKIVIENLINLMRKFFVSFMGYALYVLLFLLVVFILFAIPLSLLSLFGIFGIRADGAEFFTLAYAADLIVGSFIRAMMLFLQAHFYKKSEL